MKRILVIEDDPVLNQLLCTQLQRMGYGMDGRRRWSEAESFLAAEQPDLVLLDYNLPDADGLELLPRLVQHQPVIMLTAYGSVQNAVRAIKTGAAEYLVKPINLDELELAVARALENATLRREHQFLKSRIEAKPFKMVGASAAIGEVRRLIEAVAPSDMTVLVQGESGAGKELVAHAIHEFSGRASHTYVAVDCCTLQKHLFESELFGHERGAFTGADRQKKGLIEGAESGTLFLDEIGEIEPAIQAKLLRVLETGRFRRVGSNKDLSANVRIVAATNRDLLAMSREGGFRADLYYRLSAFSLNVPPLRERRDDIADLARHFISNHDFSRRIDKGLTPNAVKALTAYDWPGNIRELKNVVERAIILSGETSLIDLEHLGFAKPPTNPVAPTSDGGGSIISDEPSLEEIERRYLKILLKKYQGHRLTVARRMGISERNIYRLIQKYKLET